ncbi:MAG: hypothetical protein A2W68_00105 [Betaproteobacteria bacterium RIFCSPLOWO2_02_64_14]|nr:MAG: hypothetical protein A2W68_00105 [Betaproteobacteria bacterium RIFCSPLOWO2_02_64_14]
MKSGKKRRNGVEVLIAEDSPTQAEKLRYLLEEHGCTVVTAPDGKQALAAARRRKPTLVISDVMMPELDGYGLCKAIKSDERLKDIPVMLVTSLSESQDVIRGLECGADNFIRKPYEGRYLLARIEQLLMNLELRKNQKMQMGVEIELGGRKHFITAERQQILDLLISTYEQAVHINTELKLREQELTHSNTSLAAMFRIAEGLNKATTQRTVCENALERALDLPGVRAGWISILEESGNFAMLASRNVPPALMQPGALEGPCLCRRKLLAGELDSMTNILECERLQQAQGDTQGLRFHASVPIWIGEQALGVMNLVGSERGLFSEEDAGNLCAVGNQLGIALARARLNERLAGRTAELQSINSELESFSYSVSHDLRAPLRHIEGYVAMLVEDAEGRLSAEAQRYLKVIVEASRHMGELIDDLLAFSRMGRVEMRETRVELNALVREAIHDLEMATRGRNIVWTIPSLPTATGDRAMLKQALANLLGNAVKYTRPRDPAQIEMGCAGEEDGQLVLFVRDNGVGFDMQYVDKLFGVFQRLHRADEFEGTGIGLANVRRIITRHGGRVWAEGKTGEGAAFYFTLKPLAAEQPE